MFGLRDDVLGAWYKGLTPQEVAEELDVGIDAVELIIAEQQRKVLASIPQAN